MRILHISNVSAKRCGTQNHAQQCSTALRRAGHAVIDWDGTYPVIYEKLQRDVPAYLPADANDYDVVHLNWHPASINHYTLEHFAGLDHPVLSVRLTDLPPWSGCPCLDAFTVRITAEPHALSTLVVPNPVVDWVEDLPAPNKEFTVGVTGVRKDGYQIVKDACAARGWQFNASDPATWLSIEDEIRRLARSTVNVCWYTGVRGVAGAPSTCLASRRPLLINHSPMLRHLINRENVWFHDPPGSSGVLGEALKKMFDLRHLLDRPARGFGRQHTTTTRVYVARGAEGESIPGDLSWTTAAARMVEHWKESRA